MAKTPTGAGKPADADQKTAPETTAPAAAEPVHGKDAPATTNPAPEPSAPETPPQAPQQPEPEPQQAQPATPESDADAANPNAEPGEGDAPHPEEPHPSGLRLSDRVTYRLAEGHMTVNGRREFQAQVIGLRENGSLDVRVFFGTGRGHGDYHNVPKGEGPHTWS